MKKDTDAKIAIASLSVIGEKLNSEHNQAAEEYNEELKRISKKNKLNIYLFLKHKKNT